MADPNHMTPIGKTYAQIDAEQAEWVRQANVALASHRDKGGRWWRYAVSHCTFELVVGDPIGRGGNVVLCFPACEFVNGPISWPHQQLKLDWVCDRNADKAWWYILKDETVGFHLEAGVLKWRKDYDLLEHGSPYFGADWFDGSAPPTHLEYRCPKCAFRCYGYHPYCSECGAQLPSEIKMQALGLASPTAAAAHLFEIGYNLLKNYKPL